MNKYKRFDEVKYFVYLGGKKVIKQGMVWFIYTNPHKSGTTFNYDMITNVKTSGMSTIMSHFLSYFYVYESAFIPESNIIMKMKSVKPFIIKLKFHEYNIGDVVSFKYKSSIVTGIIGGIDYDKKWIYYINQSFNYKQYPSFYNEHDILSKTGTNMNFLIEYEKRMSNMNTILNSGVSPTSRTSPNTNQNFVPIVLVFVIALSYGLT